MSDLTRDHSDSTGDGDFQQLTGAFDRPIAPASSFADALKTQLLTEPIAASVSHMTVVASKATSSGVDLSSPNSLLPERTVRAFQPSWAGAFETAAAVALVVAIVLAAVLNGRPAFIFDFNESEQPTAPAPAPNIVNWGGDAGRSQYYGDDLIDTSVPPHTVEVGALGTQAVGPGLIVGDSWYGWTFRSGSHEFQRVDVQTHRQVWVKNYRTWGTLASDGERIFTLLVEESDTMEAAPVGIDIRTGEIVWRGPQLDPFASFVVQMPDALYLAQPIVDDNGPVVLDELVYFTDHAGMTVALDTNDGTERWRHDGKADGASPNIDDPTGGTIVANDSYLFVTMTDGSVVKLDPRLGKELGYLDKGNPFGNSRTMTGIALKGNRLVITRVSAYVEIDSDNQKFPALVVLDADTLDVVASADFIEGSVSGNIVVSDESAFIYAQGETGVAQIFEIDLATGEMSQGFGGGALAGDVQLSASGDTLIATSSTGVTFYFSMTTHDLVGSYRIDHPGPITPVGGPVQVVDGRPVVVWKTGSNDRIVPLEPVATPAP